MVLFPVDKVVVVALVEATRTTLEQVGTLRMEQAERGVDSARKLMAMYGELRRLKDYLQRCVGAFRDRVELDLAEDDLPLLAACCSRGAETTDLRLAACTDGRERELLQSRRDLLLDWAVELASEPLLDLQLPNLAPAISPAMRGLRMRLSDKFARDKVQLGYGEFDHPSPQSGPLDGAIADSDARLESAWASGSVARAPAPERAASAGVDANPRPPRLPASAPPRRSNTAETAAQGPAGPAPQSEPDAGRLLSVNSIRDPRLRAMMALDLRALDRAAKANDHRMAAVHLTSVLEGAVVDHALQRTIELGLSGSPDAWNPQEVLLRIFGDQGSARDRAAAYHVFAARSLIRPAMQLKVPIVVTAVTLRKHWEFVAHALHVMGFTR